MNNTMHPDNRAMTVQETLANARVAMDPLPARNLGFYIVSQPAEQRWPQLYLRRDGRWTLGIHSPDEEYYWPTKEAAEAALAEARAKATPPAPPKSGQDRKVKVAAHTEEQIEAFCRSHSIPRQNVVRIRRAEDLYGWRTSLLLQLPSWWLGTDSEAIWHARDRGWTIVEVTEEELLNGPTMTPPAESPPPECSPTIHADMNGIQQIAAERTRQIEDEKWTPEHDAEHVNAEMVEAAIGYAESAGTQVRGGCGWHNKPENWPWHTEWWKPSDDPIRNLVKAGALIAAEIDRLQRNKP